MNDNEIIDIILDDLKKKSPRNLITDILSPRQIWDKKDEHQISNIITLLKDKQLIKINGGDKYFPATDMNIGIKGDAIELINQYGSYLSFINSRMPDKKQMKKPISNVSLTFASDVLAETQQGLTSTQIGKYFSAKSLDYSVDIPHYKLPFTDVANKRTAFLENLQRFNSDQQFEIINELSEQLAHLDSVKDLKHKLYSQYPDYIPDGEQILKSELVKETQHWLKAFAKSFELYNSALDKFAQQIYQRNLVDDLRLSLEVLLKELLNNNKPLEKQIADVGAYQQAKGISSESTNMFNTLLDYYSKYQNKYVKHDDNVNEKEIEFIVDLTSTFMKFITKH
jgi:hypothetical protein